MGAWEAIFPFSRARAIQKIITNVWLVVVGDLNEVVISLLGSVGNFLKRAQLINDSQGNSRSLNYKSKILLSGCGNRKGGDHLSNRHSSSLSLFLNLTAVTGKIIDNLMSTSLPALESYFWTGRQGYKKDIIFSQAHPSSI